MIKKKRKRGDNPNSTPDKRQEKTFCLLRKLRESEDRFLKLQGDYKKLHDEFLCIDRQLQGLKWKCQKLQEENESTKEELSLAEHKEAIERYLKNAAYSFLLSEGYRYNYRVNVWQQ